MEGTRLRLAALLQREPDSTVEEMGRSLGLSSATVRRHLDILYRDRLVDYHAVRRKPGRPEHAYHLTEAGQEALPKRYVHLLQMILRAMSQTNGSTPTNAPSVAKLLTHVAEDMLAPHLERFRGKPPHERRAFLEELLNEAQFAPALEEGPEGLRVRLYNCPFRFVALEHPAICALDRELISAVLGAPATLERCITNGHHNCTYAA